VTATPIVNASFLLNRLPLFGDGAGFGGGDKVGDFATGSSPQAARVLAMRPAERTTELTRQVATVEVQKSVPMVGSMPQRKRDSTGRRLPFWTV